LIIGAYGYGAYTAGSYLGRSYVVFGKKTADVEAVDLRMLDTVINTSGFIINGESESDARGNITKINNGIIGLAKYNIRFSRLTASIMSTNNQITQSIAVNITSFGNARIR
jgi:hypothetical protein